MLSAPLTEFPTFMSSISMVGDDLEFTIQELIRAERKSPPVNDPARELFIQILRGNFAVEVALAQVSAIVDPIERKCALNVMGR